jgi:hypothetical protein
MKDEKDLKQYKKMDQRGKTPDRQKKIPPGTCLFLLCLLFKVCSMEAEVT